MQRAPDGWFHPSTEEELVALVRRALKHGTPLRVRGAAHSIREAIYTDARLEGRLEAVDVSLDRFTCVTFDDARLQVTAAAGLRLGEDVRAIGSPVSFERSLTGQLEARGWALPDLGGVTHQSVAGFFATGSSGGSVQHCIEDALVALRFVDGRGELHEARRGEPLFDAVSCSMGLLGVVTAVTLQCVPRYDVVGREDATPDTQGPFDLFGSGSHGLEAFFRRTEYARLMWWPQPGVRRFTAWQARRMRGEDYDEVTGPRGALKRVPYSAVVRGAPEALTQPLSEAVQAVGGGFLNAIDLARASGQALSKTVPALAPVIARAGRALEDRVVPTVLRTFVPVDEGGPQRFRDAWCRGLPMDNQMSERSLPTTFTEIWVPLERTHEVMDTLRALFDREGFAATGHFIVELYAARATRGWLHPGVGRDSLRVDAFWFEKNRGSPQPFFSRFWDALAPFDYRLHWGKHLPADAGRSAEYLAARYPRWHDFLKLRSELDPGGVFLTRHFAHALGIADAAPRRSGEVFLGASAA